MSDPKKGTELADRYTLVRTLGSGADTQTWLATDRITRASVAIKMRRGERISTAALREEWQTSIRLMHPHIVRVFEFHDDPECTFYSLQYVDGSDISVLSGAPLAALLPPVGLLADALRYAHGKGIVHRDIKASNVLMDQHGAPYLSDFGAAAKAMTMSSGGSLIAASPQSIAGEPATAADDIFALGGLMFELITGSSPYSSANTADDIVQLTPPPMTAACGDAVPRAVQELVASMLAKDAAARPDAVSVVQQLALAGFKGGTAPSTYVAGRKTSNAEIIEAQRSTSSKARSFAASASDNTEKTSGISPRTLGVSLLVLLALLVGVIFVLPDTVSQDPQTVALDPQPAAAEVTEDGAVPGAQEGSSSALPQRDQRVVARADTEVVLGQLLSMMATLESRAVQRWGGLRYQQAREIYEAGDAAYLARDYATASDRYLETIAVIEPLLDEVDIVFARTMAEGQAALDAANAADALQAFELAVAISSGDTAAQTGLARAKSLDAVLSMTDQALTFEKSMEFAAARQNFERAVELDPQWQPAQEGLARVTETMRQLEFELRMTEGLIAISDGYYDAARAAFRMAQALDPSSPEPADGLQQLDQAVRLQRIQSLEQQSLAEVQNEEWEAAIDTYTSILEIDSNLEFAQQGLVRAQQMQGLHKQLDSYIAEPDALSAPATMQRATAMVVDITRMPEVGPRLAAQRDELSRLLKRAATPLLVQLVSDDATDVSIYKVAKLGSFATHELSLRPGKYVAVGNRPGYRDVRIEFLVGPEQEAKPIVIRCEETI